MNEHTLLIDNPSEKDYIYEEMFGSTIEMKEIPVPVITIQNQWKFPHTGMACGEYGLVHIINMQDKLQAKFKWFSKWLSYFTEIKADKEWTEFLKLYPNAEWEGSSLQQNMEFQRKRGNITGWATCKTKEAIMHAIDNQNYIYTGSTTGDWNYVRSNHIYRLRTDGKKSGHITCYPKYDANGVWGINSSGPDNGKFFCPWDIFLNDFFTKNAIIDSKWADIYVEYRKNKKIEILQ